GRGRRPARRGQRRGRGRRRRAGRSGGGRGRRRGQRRGREGRARQGRVVLGQGLTCSGKGGPAATSRRPLSHAGGRAVSTPGTVIRCTCRPVTAGRARSERQREAL